LGHRGRGLARASEEISACSGIVLVAKIPLLGWQFDDRDLAIADLSALIGRDPRRPSHYAALGKAYQAKSDDESALKDLNQSIMMDPGDPFYKIARAASHRRKRAYDRAIADAAAAIAIQPYFAVFYIERDDSLLRKGGSAERALRSRRRSRRAAGRSRREIPEVGAHEGPVVLRTRSADQRDRISANHGQGHLVPRAFFWVDGINGT
jgi:tetratricopeptide (TPR) repeat protein